MKIYKPLLSIYLAIAAVIFVPAMNAASNKAHTDKKILEKIETEFDAANNQPAKFAIVCRHIGEDFQVDGKSYASENTLSLAIRVGQAGQVANFLSAVPDINSELLHIWGYRQIFNIAHVALDPIDYGKDPVDLYSRLIIIDLIAQKGANFDWTPSYMGIGIYRNPPLGAGDPRGHHSQHMNALRARALLLGANPCLTGSSFSGLEKNMDVFQLALDQFYDLTRNKVRVKPTEYTLKMMKAIADEREAAHKALFA